MNKATLTELSLHFPILNDNRPAFVLLTNCYSKMLGLYLNHWYGRFILHDDSLVQEAVFETLKQYQEHPRRFNPERDTLQQFLEISAGRIMQEILQREHIEFPQLPPERMLVKYFDNSADIQIALMILRGEESYPIIVNLLDIGALRIGEQMHEIERHKNRIQKILIAENIKGLKKTGNKMPVIKVTSLYIRLKPNKQKSLPADV